MCNSVSIHNDTMI